MRRTDERRMRETFQRSLLGLLVLSGLFGDIGWSSVMMVVVSELSSLSEDVVAASMPKKDSLPTGDGVRMLSSSRAVSTGAPSDTLGGEEELAGGGSLCIRLHRSCRAASSPCGPMAWSALEELSRREAPMAPSSCSSTVLDVAAVSDDLHVRGVRWS